MLEVLSIIFIIGVSQLIVLFEGRMGSGKSLTSTAYSIMELIENNRKIIANASIFLPELRNIDTGEELEMYAETEPWGDINRVVEAGYIFDAINPNTGEKVFDEETGKPIRLKECKYERLTYDKLVHWMENNTMLYDATIILDEAYLYSDSRLSQSAFNRLMSYLFLQTRKRNLDLYVNSQQFENVDIRLRKNIDTRFICAFDKYSQFVSFKIIDIRSGRRSRRKYLYGPDWFPFFDTEEIPDLRPSHTKIVL